MSRTKRFWFETIVVFCAALALYAIGAGEMLFEQSLAPHYVHLADAFLHGQTSLRVDFLTFDIIDFGGSLYVPSPPLPAVLFMPFVWLFEVEFSDVLFSVLLGAVNVALVNAAYKNRWLTAFFALGTPHLYFSSLGSVWFQAQAVAIFFCLLSILVVMRWRNGFAASLLWCCAVLARPTLLFGLIYPLWLTTERQKGSIRSNLRHVLSFGVPVLLCLSTLAVYNEARFGNWREFGYQHMMGADNIVAAIEQFGTFSPRYLPCNLRVSLLALPVFNGQVNGALLAACAHIVPTGVISLPTLPVQPNPLGMSLFIASPLFLLLLGIPHSSRNAIALVSLVAVMLPNWLLHNTGSLQFGYRYWLDASVLWLALLASVYETRSGSRWRSPFHALVLLSIVINIAGFLWMFRNFVGTSWLGL